MRAALIYGPGDFRVEDHPEPTIINLTDAVIRLTTACVCGSGLWPYRGIVEEIGTEVTGASVGDLIMNDVIDPGKVFDLEVSLDEIGEGCAAMDERRAIKALVRL
ncbi:MULTISPECIES: hypothetical protein [unclassified Brevibacterium]|uniref:hypothetical protein n=1 Tax=unclassified Brevibacterium TaxID=2614124 RepID=UPI0010926F0C|nr:hypothetical protein [Brevibacterium sp. S22]TGD31144.1 hypothetical protein EB835_09890 [Brevibacterium sp. S22]